MCGLAGGFTRSTDANIEPTIKRALTSMRHRGPNDHGFDVHRSAEGVVALGQTRLSVIDLTSGGHQPMFSDDNRFAIVFNGEIYNYRELAVRLKNAGHQFRSASDTEVLLKAWIEWGAGCLTELEGMFAFVVHDRQRQTLACVRDAFGIKPFFYTASGSGFWFASEPTALLTLAGKEPAPDMQSAYDYLVHADYDSGPRTFFEGVSQLQPGRLVELDLREPPIPEERTWWTPSTAPVSTLSRAAAAEAVREMFLHNVRLHLRSDVALGAALSGGIDSSAVVCAMRRLEPDAAIHTFSYIAEGDAQSEEPWIDLVNETAGAIPHKVRVSSDELIRDIDALISTQGEPFGTTSIYAQYRVFQLAREHDVTVTLDGQGADELLAGYAGYPGQRMLSFAERGDHVAMARFASAWSRWPGRSYAQAWMYLADAGLPDALHGLARQLSGRAMSPRWLREKVLTDGGVRFREKRYPLAEDARGRRVVERLAAQLQGRGLPQLLRHGDRNSMRWSVESRVPFLTIPMAELLLSLPEDYLISDKGESKSIFREAMRGIVPDAILDRRDKIGFVTPEKELMIGMKEKIPGWLAAAEEISFLDVKVLTDELSSMLSGKQAFNSQAWRWLNYVRWYDATGSRGQSRPT